MIADCENRIAELELERELACGTLGVVRNGRRVLRVLDVFCGAGGGTDATREAALLAGFDDVEFTLVNHWEVATTTAKANFPGARVLTTGVENVIAHHLYRPGELDMLQGGPECTEFSKAASGKPKNYQYRPTPWCMVRLAEALRPPIVLVENVAEFEKKWPPFVPWLEAFRALGYRGDRRVFNAADYGDPTTRERLFMLFVLEPLKVFFPAATHSKHADSQLEPWRDAKGHVIDWTRKGEWLDEMPGKKKYGGLPLSPKTFGRLYAGLELGGLKPMIVEFDNASRGKGAVRPADKPVSTVTGKARHAVAMPYLIHTAHGGKRRARGVDEPLPTVTGKRGDVALSMPYFVKLRGTSKAARVDAPAPTITSGGNHLALVNAFIVPKCTGEKRVRAVTKPLHTVTAGSRSEALVEAFLVPGMGDRKGQRPRTHSVKSPLPTVCASGHLHLVEPMLLPQGGGGVARKVSKPAPTVATDGAIALIEAFLVKYYGTSTAVSTREPLPTVTTKDRFALCCPVVIKDGRRRRIRFRWRMLQWYELAAAQGFRPDYIFCGEKKSGGKRAIVPVADGARKEDVVKQIGNAWPHSLGRALALAVLSQRNDVRGLLKKGAMVA